MKLSAKLQFVAVLALVVAGLVPSAAAAYTEFEASEYVATISGEQVGSQTLTLEGEVKVVCKKVSFSGELPEPSETLTVTPAYSECTALGSGASVKTNGCQFVLKGTEETEEGKFKGTKSISCPGEQSIVVLAGAEKCEAKIGTQSNLSSVTYIDEGASPPNVKMEDNLSGIHYTVSKDEGTCPFAAKGEKTNGSLTGSSTLKASVAAEAQGLAVITAGPTRLCKEPPAKKNVCAGEVWPKGTLVRMDETTPVTFQLSDGVFLKNEVECSWTTFNGTTKEESGTPLNLEKVSLTFTFGCQTLPNKTACATVSMLNSPTTATLKPSKQLGPGDGILTVPMKLKLSCGAEIEECEYETSKYLIWVRGAAKPTMFPSTFQKKIKNIAGKKGCFNDVIWFASYARTFPGEFWVTN